MSWIYWEEINTDGSTFFYLFYVVHVCLLALNGSLTNAVFENDFWRKRHYANIFLEGLKKTTNTFSQDSRYPNRDQNWGPSKYESAVLTRP
jgi:hypothetical protein